LSFNFIKYDENHETVRREKYASQDQTLVNERYGCVVCSRDRRSCLRVVCSVPGVKYGR